MKKLIIILSLMVFIPFVVSAHPGGTDSSGCHTCRTNCSNWGLSTGQYHCHNAKSLPQPEYPIRSTYGENGTGYTTPEPSYAYPSYTTITTCPKNSYESFGSCKCNYGYIVQNGSCVDADNYCRGSDYNSEYDSISKNCKCKSNYVIGSSGKCESGDSVCEDKYGYNSNYDSYSNKCKCDSGYYLINDKCRKGDFIYINSLVKNKDEALITDSKSNSYLIEYGVGCLSIWKYEKSSSKLAFIEIGGSFLDGISDYLYLIDDDRSCKIWDAKEMELGSSYYNSKNNLSSCPQNSTLNNADNKCYCNNDYELSSDSKSCILKTSCGVNSKKINNTCVCNDGYVLKNNSCISYTDDCKLSFGDNVYGVKGDDNNSFCYCNSNYLWNSDKTSCIENKTISCMVNAHNYNGSCFCDNGYKFNTSQTICEKMKECGANAYAGFDNECYCESEYELDSNGNCVLPLICPSNSQKINKECLCSDGYKMINNNCEKVNNLNIATYSNAYKTLQIKNDVKSNYKYPVFKFNGIDNISGYYVYFGLNKNADPIKLGKYITKNEYQVLNINKVGDYYLIVKTKGKDNKISDSYIFKYTYALNLSKEEIAVLKNKEKVSGPSQLKNYKNVEKIGSNLWGNKK